MFSLFPKSWFKSRGRDAIRMSEAAAILKTEWRKSLAVCRRRCGIFKPVSCNKLGPPICSSDHEEMFGARAISQLVFWSCKWPGRAFDVKSAELAPQCATLRQTAGQMCGQYWYKFSLCGDPVFGRYGRAT